MFYNFSFFAKPSMDFIHLWCDDTALSKILCSTIPIPVHDLKIKVTDFEFFGVKSLQCQLLQSLWMIWVVFGMNGYKILKCFRKEKARLRRAALSGDRSCCCLFGFNVAFNNFSVISRRFPVVTGSSVLTFIVLPHWSIMPQTHTKSYYPDNGSSSPSSTP